MSDLVYWYSSPSRHEQAEVDGWLARHDCSQVAVIAIGNSAVMVESVDAGWGSTELRSQHATLSDALTSALRFLSL